MSLLLRRRARQYLISPLRKTLHDRMPASGNQSTTQYRERAKSLEVDLAFSQQSYPAYLRPSNFYTPAQVIGSFGNAEKGECCEGRSVATGGRILAIRAMGSALSFLDIYHDGHRLQVIVNASTLAATGNDYEHLIGSLQRGDCIEIEGTIGRSKVGELSIRAHTLRIVAPCLRNIPSLSAPELTEEHRVRWRHLDLLSKPEHIRPFQMRSHIIRHVRRFLDERHYLEVETPTLSDKKGGAMARPFHTKLDTLSLPLTLRVAPELFLKQLIVAGFDRVYELGKVYRNEGLDPTHNPEFTSLEIYQSYASRADMMLLARELLASTASSIKGTSQLSYQGGTLDFASPFEEIDIVPALESLLGVTFALADEEELIKQCTFILHQHHVHFDESNKSASYLFDKLIGHWLEPLCQKPTFLLNHPLFMSPLARCHPQNPLLSDRFELFVVGRELMNGYSELNDPAQQQARFRQQAIERGRGSEEAHPADEDFVEVLAAGMPPTAGCGIGIDRLVMLLTDKRHIRNVLLFPLCKPKLDK